MNRKLPPLKIIAFLLTAALSISLSSAQAAEELGNILIESADLTLNAPKQNIDRQTAPITIVISEIVNPKRIPEYEDWQRGIHEVLMEFTGFKGVDVIRPSEHSHPEHVTILKFDTYTHLRQWRQSPEFKEWIAKSKQFIIGDTHLQQDSGLELWFTLPDNDLRREQKPAYYKMVIIGTLVVYSLILIIRFLLGRFLDKLPFPLGMFISVLIVSSLMTYPVLPWVTELLDFWLFPLPE